MELDVGIEHGDEPFEVTGPRSGQEGIEHLALYGEVGVGLARRASDPAARAACELPRRLGRAVDDRRDLLEQDGEDGVQHERQAALGGDEALQDHQEREPDGIGKRRRVPARPAGRSGDTDWVRNLRAAREATLSERGRQLPVEAVEPPIEIAAPVLHDALEPFLRTRFGSRALRRYYDLVPGAPLDADLAEARRHPIFELRPRQAA